MPTPPPPVSMSRYQKMILGMVGLVMLSVGGLMYVLSPSANLLVSAILVRVGTLLCVIWLAWDQILQLSKYFSVIVVATAMGLLVLIAARPNFAKFAVLIVVALTVVSVLSKFFRHTGK